MKMFALRLASLRRERGLTQEGLADIVKKGRSTISGYETEGKEPDLETVCLLAKFFGVSTDYLLGASSERHCAETVFLNDNINFKKHYDDLPPELKSVVSKIFDSFYLLLNRDIQLSRPERLLLYQKLLATLQSLRADIRNRIESSGTMNDAATLAELLLLQNELKSSVCIVLDELMQSDIKIAFSDQWKSTASLDILAT